MFEHDAGRLHYLEEQIAMSDGYTTTHLNANASVRTRCCMALIIVIRVATTAAFTSVAGTAYALACPTARIIEMRNAVFWRFSSVSGMLFCTNTLMSSGML